MSVMPEIVAASDRPYWRTAFARSMVSVVGIGADTAVIIAMSALTGAIYHLVAYGEIGPWVDFLNVGATAASIFVLPSIIRGDYSLGNYFSFKPHIRGAFNLWNVTFLCLLT